MDSNIFDQFDEPETAPTPAPVPTSPSGTGVTISPAPLPAPTASSGNNIFDQFDAPSSSLSGSAAASQPSLDTLAEAPAVGFNRGLADIVGAPVDAVNWGMGKFNLPTSNTPFMGSNFLKQSMGLIGANPDQHPPLTAAERALQGAGEGAASFMVPEAGVGALGEKLAAYAPKTADFLESTFGSAKSTPAALANAGVGAASGFGSSAAGELPVPDQWKPLVQMAGGIGGGGIGAIGAEVPTLARQGAIAARNFIAPMTKTGPESLAGARLATAAGGKDALSSALQDNPGLLVPGSVPTLAEQTQIPGISALQHQVETQNGVPFQERRAAQNQARVGALTSIQPTGSPEDIANFVRAQLSDLDQQAEGVVNQQTAAAQTAAGELGGAQTPEFYGAQISGQVQPQINAATAAARTANQGLGEYGTPEQVGSQLRGAAQTAENSANKQINALYDAVDPHNTLNTVLAPLREQAGQIAKTVNPAAGDEMTADEKRLFQAASSLPDVGPFSTLRALDRNVTAAMSAERAANGKTGAYARLVQLKNATQDAIQNGVANQVAYERQAVQRGIIAPENTTEGRVNQWQQKFYADKQEAAGRNYAEGAFGNAGSGPSSVSGLSRAARQGRGGFGYSQGSEGISAPPIVPNFDQGAADRLAAANQTYAAFAQAKAGPIANILRTNGFAGQYKLIDSGVPDQIFVAGPKGYETAMKYRKFVGDDPTAIAALRNYAAMSARRAAERPDNTLDPQKFGAWRIAHDDALRAVPEIRPQFSRIDQAAKELQKFAPFRPDLAPSAIPEMFFHSGPSGAEGVRQLRSLLGDEQTNAILKDYAASRLKQAAARPDGTLDPAKTATWIKQHSDALGEMPGLADRFSTVAKASEAIADAAAARKTATHAYQQGALGKLLKVSDPADVTRTIGDMFGQKNSVSEFRRLASLASKDPDAAQGLRKAIVDHIYNSFVGNAESLKSDMFQTFLRKNRAALETVFKPDEIQNMNAIAAELARTRKVFEQSHLPGQSSTAPDLAAAKKAEEGAHGHGHGVLGALGNGSSLLGKMALGAYAGWETAEEKGAVLGALGALGSHVIGAMRGAGLKKADDLVKEALLNKTGDGALAKALLMRAPVKTNVGSEVTLAHQLRRIAVLGAASAY